MAQPTNHATPNEKNGNTSTPKTHQALVLTSVDEPLTVQTLPVPDVQPGTAILQVLASSTLSYAKEIFQSSSPNYRKYPFPTPIIPGSSAVGRVASAAPDASFVKPGLLILFDSFVRGRDLDGSSSTNPAGFLSAIHEGYSDGSKQLMRYGGVRDGSYAQYMRVMLENCYILDEHRLLKPVSEGGLGYTIPDLLAIPRLMVPYGGLRSVDVRPGEIVLISPATGPFGGAACMVALALGARVIAWGRSVAKLEEIKDKLSAINNERYKGMIDIVPLTSDANEDLKNIKIVAGGSIDVFFDISPPVAQGSHHLKTGILSLRHSGRVSLMGGFRDDVPIPHVFVMHFDITIKGKWMCDRSDAVELIKLVERGLLSIGKRGGWEVAGQFGLAEWKEAWDVAYEKNQLGELVVMIP